jgi:hypothetical protein
MLLCEALRAKHGIAVSDPNPLALRQRLYAEQRRDSTFAELQFILSPTRPKSELWITKGVNWHGKRD